MVKFKNNNSFFFACFYIYIIILHIFTIYIFILYVNNVYSDISDFSFDLDPDMDEVLASFNSVLSVTDFISNVNNLNSISVSDHTISNYTLNNYTINNSITSFIDLFQNQPYVSYNSSISINLTKSNIFMYFI